MNEVELTVNGTQFEVAVEPRTLLVHALRETIGLTGTNIGCESSVCGACTVHLDGRAVKSCNVLAVQAAGSEITTIEGLAENGELHPLQASFQKEHGLQCGYCTPGMVMNAADLIDQNSDLTREEIRSGLEGNLCRCTGYQNIVTAVKAVADQSKTTTNGGLTDGE